MNFRVISRMTEIWQSDTFIIMEDEKGFVNPMTAKIL